MQMSPKTVHYGGKTQVSATDGFCKNLGFGVSFGYRSNTSCDVLPSNTSYLLSFCCGEPIPAWGTSLEIRLVKQKVNSSQVILVLCHHQKDFQTSR